MLEEVDRIDRITLKEAEEDTVNQREIGKDEFITKEGLIYSKRCGHCKYWVNVNDTAMSFSDFKRMTKSLEVSEK